MKLVTLEPVTLVHLDLLICLAQPHCRRTLSRFRLDSVLLQYFIEGGDLALFVIKHQHEVTLLHLHSFLVLSQVNKGNLCPLESH